MNTTIPFNYPMCANARCQKSAHCLRHYAHISCSVQQITTMYINPKLTDGDKDGCPYYRDANTVVYARGMKSIMKELPHGQHQKFRMAMMSNFSRTTFYRMRNGDVLISPQQQQYIKALSLSLGIDSLPHYDEYLDAIDWGEQML